MAQVRKWCNPGFKRVRRMTFKQLLRWNEGLRAFNSYPSWTPSILQEIKFRLRHVSSR